MSHAHHSSYALGFYNMAVTMSPGFLAIHRALEFYDGPSAFTPTIYYRSHYGPAASILLTASTVLHSKIDRLGAWRDSGMHEIRGQGVMLDAPCEQSLSRNRRSSDAKGMTAYLLLCCYS